MKSLFRSGFTYIELVVVLGIMAILLTFTTINLSSLQNKTNLSSAFDTVISDIKQQQLKAMLSDTEVRTTGDSYGIHFETSRYVLFHGLTYNSNDSSNFPISLDTGLSFSSITFPSGNLIFNQISGEFVGYASNANSVTMKNATTNQQKTVYFNRYGVISQIN